MWWAKRRTFLTSLATALLLSTGQDVVGATSTTTSSRLRTSKTAKPLQTPPSSDGRSRSGRRTALRLDAALIRTSSSANNDNDDDNSSNTERYWVLVDAATDSIVHQGEVAAWNPTTRTTTVTSGVPPGFYTLEIVQWWNPRGHGEQDSVGWDGTGAPWVPPTEDEYLYQIKVGTTVIGMLQEGLLMEEEEEEEGNVVSNKRVLARTSFVLRPEDCSDQPEQKQGQFTKATEREDSTIAKDPSTEVVQSSSRRSLQGATTLEYPIKILVLPDAYPAELSWTLFQFVGDAATGEFVAGIIGSTDPYVRFIPAGRYAVELQDSLGDGICCFFGEGSFRVVVNGVLVAESDGRFGDSTGLLEFTLLESGEVLAPDAPTGSAVEDEIEVVPQTVPAWLPLGLAIEGEAAGDLSGYAVALSDDGYTVAIGAINNDGANGGNSGHVRVHSYDRATLFWSQKGQDIDGEAASDQFGQSVALSGNGRIVAVGARLNDGNGNNAGHVRVFAFDMATQWTQLGQDLEGAAAVDQFGYTVDLSNNGLVVAIGGRENDDNGDSAGHVRVLEYNATSTMWTPRGPALEGVAPRDDFGTSVALSMDGLIVAVGASGNDAAGSAAGHVRVFTFIRASAEWIQVGQDIVGEKAGDESGFAVALSADGRTVAIGAYYNDGASGANSGHVRVWTLNAGRWLQLGQDLDGEAATDLFGLNVALSDDGTTVAVGAGLNDGNGVNAGHVRVFDYNSDIRRWEQVGEDLDGEESGDNFGGEFGRQAVALSADGRIVAAGAPYNDGNGSSAGHVRLFVRA